MPAISVLASHYLSLKLNSDYFEQSLKTYSKIDPGFFSKIILLTKAVKEKTEVVIEYSKLTDNITSNYLIRPHNLIESQSNWVLHAIKEGETMLYNAFFNNSVFYNGKYRERFSSKTASYQHHTVKTVG